MNNFRTDKQPTEIIDREKQVRFEFEGESYTGFAGDSVASALLASGLRTLGRSFKYHRPRSAYSLAGHDINMMIEDGHNTNMRGDRTPIAEGATYRAVNTCGSLKRDWLSWTEKLSKFMPVGFYYKAFHSKKLFPFYERQLRRVAGLGKLDPHTIPQDTPKCYDFADVLVVGSGPTGLAAALEAAGRGLHVIVVDDQPYAGGSLRYQHGRDRLENMLAQVRANPNIDLRTSTQAAGYYADHWIALVDEQKLTKLRARSVITATGVFEQPAVFGHNDMPGVMLGSAAQRLLHLYAVKPCNDAVILAGNDDAYRLALQLIDAGVRIAAIAELRSVVDSDLAQQVASRNVKIYRGHAIYEAVGNMHREVEGARLCPVDAEGNLDTDHPVLVQCDGILVSVGWAPNAALLYQAGGKFAYDILVEQFTPRKLPEGMFAAGRVNGVFDLDDRIADGKRAAIEAAHLLTGQSPPASIPIRHRGSPPSHPYPIFDHEKKKNFVEFDEDIHLVDFVNAVKEGYDNIELLKRYTTVGMGPSQGKLANMNAVRILARLTGKGIDETGSTTSRPFYHPVSMKHLAGRRFHPHRHTPMQDWHAKHDAVFMLAGVWPRPEYYALPGRTKDQCVLAEAKNVRDNVGIIDVGTLGKLEISGADAAAFLESTYTGKFAKQEVGKLRYCLALDESGIVIDDGVVVRLADDRFYVTATTSGAAAVYQQMQRNAILWGMQVTLVNSTGRYGGMNIAGPRSREILATLTDVDLSPAAFPYLAAREGKVAGVPARLIRVGFVGELGYEVHVPVSRGLHVWESLVKAGASLGIKPFGVEAQRMLRLEKGHIIISQDTDALTNPYEAELGWAIGKDKADFVGARSLAIMKAQKQERILVGIRFPDGYTGPLPEECHLVIENDQITGRVTSIAKQSTLGYPLGLAFVRPHQNRPGKTIHIRVEGGAMVEANVAELPFHDPDLQRQKA